MFKNNLLEEEAEDEYVNPLKFIIPGICDFACCVLLYLGLAQIDASVY